MISSDTAGMSARPSTTPHSVRLSGWVLNIGLRKGTKTVTTSSKIGRRTAPTSQGLENTPIWNSESRSERQVKARNNSHRESVTKAMVSAVCTSTPRPIVLEEKEHWVGICREGVSRLEMPDEPQGKSCESRAGLGEGLYHYAQSHRAMNDRLGLGTRRPLHHVRVTLLLGQCQGRRAVGHHVQPQELNGRKRAGQASERGQED